MVARSGLNTCQGDRDAINERSNVFLLMAQLMMQEKARYTKYGETAAIAIPARQFCSVPVLYLGVACSFSSS